MSNGVIDINLISKEFIIKLDDPDKVLLEMVEKAKIIKDSLVNKTLPERTKNFLCDGMCPFATKCFEDNREKYE